MKYTHIAFGACTFMLAFGLSLQGGYYLQGKYEESLQTSSMVYRDSDGFDVFRSRNMNYRQPGDPRISGREFEVTNSTVGHPMFQYIWEAYNTGLEGKSAFDADGKWLGYKQGHLSTQEQIEWAKNSSATKNLQYRGSRATNTSTDFLASASEDLSTRREFLSNVVQNKYGSKNVNDFAARNQVRPGTVNVIRSTTPAEMSIRYREYLEAKRAEILKNTPSVETDAQ